VHEIVLDRDFQLQAASFSPKSLENRVKEPLHKAFWNSLEEQLSFSPPGYPRGIQLLQEIKEGLLSLPLPWHNQRRSQIEEALDVELIRQEAEHEALAICTLTTYVLGTMARLCAPARGEEVQGLQNLTDPAQLLRWVMLTLPWSTHQQRSLQPIRTHLQDHTIQYEWKKFQELLDKLPNSLEHTREWLRKAAAEESFSSPQPPPYPAGGGTSPGADSHGTTVPSLMSVLNGGYMNLLCWEPRLNDPELPSTQLPGDVTALLHGLRSARLSAHLFGSPGFVTRLKWVTKALLEGLSSTRYEAALEDISDQVLQEVSRTLAQLGYPAFTTDKCSSLKSQIKSITDKGNAVWHVIEQRIHFFLSLFIAPDGQNSQKDFPKGLNPIQEELLEVGRSFGSMMHHNR
ncbi:TCP11 protein, partial [Jacana jacana]|nr:TCP11 protein [Jacana jacana]